MGSTPLDALTQAPLAVWLRTSAWAYPGLEVVHIVGIALMLGSVFVIDFKILGIRSSNGSGGSGASVGAVAEPDAQALSRACLVWSVIGFAIVAVSGSIMLFARIGELIGNSAFLWKIGLLSSGISNAILLHNRKGLDVAPLNGVVRYDVTTKLQAALSIAIWIATISAGRWIAYV